MAVDKDAATALLQKAFGSQSSATETGTGTTSISSNTGWYDPDKIDAAVAGQKPGADGRTILTGPGLTSILNPMTGIVSSGGSESSYDAGNQSESGNNGGIIQYYTGPSFKSDQGQDLTGLLEGVTGAANTTLADKDAYDAATAAQAKKMGLDPTKQYAVGTFDNPTGNGNKDKAKAVYQLDDKGNATPVGSFDDYDPSNWVDVGRQEFMNLASVVTAGVAGGAFSASGPSTATVGSGTLTQQVGTAYKAMAPILNQMGLSPTGAIGALLKSVGVGQSQPSGVPQGNKVPDTEAAAAPAATQALQSALLENLSSGINGEHEGASNLGMSDLLNAVTTTTAGMSPGQVEPGNIDMSTRPTVKNADGSVSTIKSMSVNIDGQEVLIPMVSDDGKVMTAQQAIQQFLVTGKHLGKFATPEAATAYAQKLHESEERRVMKGSK